MGEETPAPAAASQASAASEANAAPNGTPSAAKPAARRYALVLLVAGAITAGMPLMSHLPHERRLALRLDDAKHVVGVELSVTRVGEGDPLQGSAWHFAEGTAPASVETAINLPEGKYDLDVTVEGAESKRSFRRVLSVSDSDRITIPLR
jgi:hypothetical protein